MPQLQVLFRHKTLSAILVVLTGTVFVNLLVFGWFAVQLRNRPATPPVSQSERPVVAATLFPIADLVRHVAGEDVSVVQVLPNGASPHTFEPTPNTMKAVAPARVVFRVGHGIDDWSQSLTQAAQINTSVVLDRNLELLNDPDHGGSDPHYWLSPNNAEIMVQTIADELAVAFPEKAAAFQGRAAQYQETLRQLDQEIRTQLADVPHPIRIATFHNAFGYYARDYDITVVTTFEEFPGKEPSPQYVAEFIQKLKEARVPVVYTEPQSPTRILESFAQDIGIQLRELDDLGGATSDRDSYEKLLRYNTQQIRTALTQNQTTQ